MQEIDTCVLGGASDLEGMVELSSVEKRCAWNLICNEEGVRRMGKYFYVGMQRPSSIPSQWWEVDAHLLGLLTERKCKFLPQETKDFIEWDILGPRYKLYRRALRALECRVVS